MVDMVIKLDYYGLIYGGLIMHCDIPVDQNVWDRFKIKAIQKNRTINRLLADMVEEAVDYQKPVISDMGSGGKPSIGLMHGEAELSGQIIKKSKKNETINWFIEC